MSEARQKNRERFPNISSLVDRLRAAFGPGVKVIYARDGEHEIGSREAHEEAKQSFLELHP